MRDYVIFVDSACDLGKEIRDKYQIDYVQMNILVNGKEMPASLNWDVYTPKEFYDWMRKGMRIMTTQVPMNEYETKFSKYLDEGKDILYIACSSGLSGSINTARSMSEELVVKYPEAKIFCIDALRACLGQGLLGIKAAEMKNEGKTIEEVRDYIEANKLKYHQIGTVENLEYLKRAGRIKTTAAFFGNLFGVKPIVIADALGQNLAIKKVKGRRKSLDELLAGVKDSIVDPENQTICIGHADCIVDAEYLKEHLLNDIKCKDVYIDYLGPVIGASVGPGMIGIYYVGEEVTVEGD